MGFRLYKGLGSELLEGRYLEDDVLFGDDVGSIIGFIEGDTRRLDYGQQMLWKVAQDLFLVLGPDESQRGGWKELLTHWGLAVIGGSPKPLYCVSVLGPVPFTEKQVMIVLTVHLKPQFCGVIFPISRHPQMLC